MKSVMFIAFLACVSAPAYADPKAGEQKAQLCLLCHRADKQGNFVPILDGQPREYIYNQIRAFKEKRRSDPAMQTNVASLSDRDMRDIADYFSGRKPVRSPFQPVAERVAKGKLRAEEFKCAACHRADYSGNKEVPRLAGLAPPYLAWQIEDIARGKRPHPQVDGISNIATEIAEDLAQYFAQLE